MERRLKNLLILCLGLLIFCFSNQLNAQTGANNYFKFPGMINYKIRKNAEILGDCRLYYNEHSKTQGFSSLRLKDFTSQGLICRDSLLSYIFKDESSIYSTFLLEGKQKVYEIVLLEDIQFGGQKGNVLICKGKKSSFLQIAFHTQYSVANFPALFLIAAKKVYNDEKGVKRLNLLSDKSTKIVNMIYTSSEKAVFQGREETTHAVVLTYNNVEIFRFNILKDNNGYCFPVKIMIAGINGNKEDKLELIADKVAD